MSETSYPGGGTLSDPYVVSFQTELPSVNPKRWNAYQKWTVLLIYMMGMMAGLFSISAFTSGFRFMIPALGTTPQALAFGQCLFLIGLG
ncbi:hypothetical protein RQP46_007336 [Phenoliferia psychrophenolica]